ncbi:MAG: hypothetical protein KF715_21780 [Candidatus Didemnitutus sp.]|nr:hypothetical protein [Candidatus Didemnitutus sp.]
MTRREFIRSTSLLASAVVLRARSSEAPAARPRVDLLAGLSDHGDLRLPAWGPYTKHLAGVSHLPDPASGLRFDLAVFPGLYRRRQSVPMVTYDSGFQPWSATPDLRHYTLRYPLGGLEDFYADLIFDQEHGGTSIRAQLVNATAEPQQLSLHFLASLHFPEAGPYRQPPLRAARVSLPEGAVWLEASHYESLTLDEEAPQRHLPDNAEIWGEVRRDGCVNGTALAGGFGRKEGQRVSYARPAGFSPADTVALLRYRSGAGARTHLSCTGLYAADLTLEGDGSFRIVEIPLADPTAQGFTLAVSEGSEIEIDGFALVRRADVALVAFHVPPLDYRPEVTSLDSSSLALTYAAIPGVYGLAWESADAEIREWLTDRIEYDFPLYTHEHVKRRFELGGLRHYTNVFVRPLFLAPGERRNFSAFVCHAPDLAAVRAKLAHLSAQLRGELDASRSTVPPHTAAGRTYAYGIERLAATVATNVVYPVRRRGKFIRHYTPGRWWDSLYTWDSGFIGLGLLELDPARSVDNLAAYLSRADEDAAFTFHGSPVPVQIYQLHALWNRTQDTALLRRFFAPARRMHRFLAGRSEGSTTRNLGSGLLRTWDYFYNSGGWDDYPPQKFIRGTALTAGTTPVVNTAHAIRTAKILRALAPLLDEPAAEFDRDIAEFSAALQSHAWDAASGWFSYVRHDAHGAPLGPLQHDSGTNFNRGLDGIYPLVAGICTAAQRTLFLERLRDRRVFWTDVGLTTVDQSAPYYRDDGYWNGTVWFPHQWFFWKTLLDLGEGDLAWQVAETALRTWEHEVRATGCCFEHFIVRSGRGAGWHQFAGLTPPLLSWFAAYFRPGAVTGGHDCLVLDHQATAARLRTRLRFPPNSTTTPIVLAVVDAAADTARWNGRRVPARSRAPGTLEIALPANAGEGTLEIG